MVRTVNSIFATDSDYSPIQPSCKMNQQQNLLMGVSA